MYAISWASKTFVPLLLITLTQSSQDIFAENELNDTKICWRGRARLLALSAGVGPRRDMERTPYSSS